MGLRFKHWGAAIQRNVTGEIEPVDEPTQMEYSLVAPPLAGPWGPRRQYEYLRSLRNPNVLQRGLNADLLDGKHLDTIYSYLATLYQPLCAKLTAICALTGASGKLIRFTGADTVAVTGATIDGSDNLAGVNTLAVAASGASTVPNIYPVGASSYGIAIEANKVSLVTNGVARLTVDADGKITIPGELDPISLILTERASAPTVNAGYFGLWAKNDTPNVLRARDDAGSDFTVPLILTSHTLLDDALARCDGTTGRLQSSGTRLDDNDNLTVPGRVLSTADNDGIGYGTGAGGTALQSTSKSTAISIDKVCGQILTDSENLVAGTSVAFTVSNNTVAATDVVLVCLGDASGYTALSYTVRVENVQAGQFDVVLSNVTGGDLAEAVVINFAVIKAVTS